MTDATKTAPGLPDRLVSAKALFGFDTDLEVPAYSQADDHVPDLDQDYLFDKRDHAWRSWPASPTTAA